MLTLSIALFIMSAIILCIANWMLNQSNKLLSEAKSTYEKVLQELTIKEATK